MFHLISNQGNSNKNQMGMPLHTHHMNKIYFKTQTPHFGEITENWKLPFMTGESIN